MINVYEATTVNKRKSAVVVVVFFLFCFFVYWILSQSIATYLGYELGGLSFLGLAFIISGLTSFGSYYYSDKIVLGISRAKPADKNKYFLFYSVAENLSIGAGIPMPKLYVIEDSAPNAFATGRNINRSVICATSGLLYKLKRSELEGVIAHELSHIKNYDTRLMTIVTVMVGSIALISDWFFRIGFRGKRSDSDRGSSQIDAIILVLGMIFAILSPIIAQLIQLAISRRREFQADVGSVSITKQPGGLISALKKISQDIEPLEVANKATALLYIDNPFKNKINSKASWFSSLFNTHPPVEERIKILEEMT